MQNPVQVHDALDILTSLAILVFGYDLCSLVLRDEWVEDLVEPRVTLLGVEEGVKLLQSQQRCLL